MSGHLSLTPSSTTIPFDDVPIATSVTADLLLQNDGLGPLRLRLELTGDEFALVTHTLGTGDPPVWTVAAGGELSIGLRYTPVSGDASAGLLTVTPDAATALPSDPVILSLSGAPDPDADDDGALHVAAGGDDCDDDDPTVKPSAEEIWYDGVDQDCDGQDDDADGDGYGHREDCDEADPAVHPGGDEGTLDGLDSDCDGLIDEDAISALQGQVLLTEYFLESSSISEPYGQYFEFYNNADLAVPLAGARLTAADGAAAVEGLSALDPGARLLICADLDPERNGGLACDAGLSVWPRLDAADDGVALTLPIYDDAGRASQTVTLDTVAWDEAWPRATGAAVQLDPAHRDAEANDSSSAWCLSETPRDSGDLGTPGAENAACP